MFPHLQYNQPTLIIIFMYLLHKQELCQTGFSNNNNKNSEKQIVAKLMLRSIFCYDSFWTWLLFLKWYTKISDHATQDWCDALPLLGAQVDHCLSVKWQLSHILVPVSYNDHTYWSKVFTWFQVNVTHYFLFCFQLWTIFNDFHTSSWSTPFYYTVALYINNWCKYCMLNNKHILANSKVFKGHGFCDA